MTNTVPDILARIVEHKKLELAASQAGTDELEDRAAARLRDRRDFLTALLTSQPAIISEIKKASPSKGQIAADFDPRRIAREYAAGGAAALSVITDEQFFGGSLDDLIAARAEVAVPVLRKDFTIGPYHVIEAAANGADAILLIAAILTEREMRDLRELAARYGLYALVEVHGDEELERTVASGAQIIGVNNRNLHTFEVSLETSLRLAAHIPDNAIKVSESGITSRADIERLRECGYQAFLIGEHLMRAGNPREALRELNA
jgi:indole-3-glycerol phosphate synthase